MAWYWDSLLAGRGGWSNIHLHTSSLGPGEHSGQIERNLAEGGPLFDVRSAANPADYPRAGCFPRVTRASRPFEILATDKRKGLVEIHLAARCPFGRQL